LGPIVIMNAEYHDRMSALKLRKLIEATKEKDKETTLHGEN